MLNTRFPCYLALVLSSLSGLVLAQVCQPIPDAPAPGCTCQHEGGPIDLSSIASSSKDVRYTVVDGVYTYKYNPCYGMSASGCANSDTAVCQHDDTNNADLSLGSIQNEKIVLEGNTIYLQYIGGDDDRSAKVELVCEESQKTPIFEFIVEDTGLVYNFRLTSVCACPGGCGAAGPTGSIDIEVEISGPIGISLMLLFLTSIVVYFIVGALILKFHYHRQGLDIIPQREFWFGLPFLVKDGCLFTFGPCLRKAGIECGKTQYGAL